MTIRRHLETDVILKPTSSTLKIELVSSFETSVGFYKIL